jgi:hypothetical protein
MSGHGYRGKEKKSDNNITAGRLTFHFRSGGIASWDGATILLGRNSLSLFRVAFYSQGLKIKFIPTRYYVSIQILMGVLYTKKL